MSWDCLSVLISPITAAGIICSSSQLKETWGKWDLNDLLVNVMKCYECLQCWRACLLPYMEIFAGDILILVALWRKRPRTDSSLRDGGKPCSWPFDHSSFTASSFAVKALYWLCRDLKDSLLSAAVCVLYMCVFQRPRGLVIVLEQSSDSGPPRTIKNSKSTLRAQTHTWHTHTHTHSEEGVFSWHSEQLSGLGKEEADRKRLLKQRRLLRKQRSSLTMIKSQ